MKDSSHQETSTSETFETSSRPIWPGILNCIFLPGSGAGARHLEWQELPTNFQYLLRHAHASLSARRAEGSERLTKDIFGHMSRTSYMKSGLVSHLESRLQALPGLTGSTMFSLTSRRRNTPLGLSIPALLATGRRTSGSVCTGAESTVKEPALTGLPLLDWNAGERNPMSVASSRRMPPASDGIGGIMEECAGKHKLRDEAALASWTTPSARDWKDSPGCATKGVNPDGSIRTRLDQVGRQAQLTSWPTPTASAQNCQSASPDPREGKSANTTSDAAHLASWPTPMSSDGTRGSDTMSRGATNYTLTGAAKLTSEPTVGPARLTASGALLTGSDAAMGNGGPLNPALSRWLMGYPLAWDACGVTAMQSSSRRQRRSSET